ncbi:MAG: inositol monophosphatase family protein [Myxococcota bacterium]
MEPKYSVFDKKISKAACEIARKAGQTLTRHYLIRTRKRLKIEFKGDPTNLVTDVDKKVEKQIAQFIESNFPDHGILSEEGISCRPSSKYLWIVDPLDGTTNFAHGYPHFAISIGIERDGEVIIAVVYDPLRDELFFAMKGLGARLNGRRIHVSNEKELDRSLLLTGFPYDIRVSYENNLNLFNTFALKSQAVRRDGSAALNLAYVAAGRADGFWEIKLKPWDTAAGSLLVSEAGGTVTDFVNKPVDIFGKEIVATNGKIHSQVLTCIKETCCKDTVPVLDGKNFEIKA